jgi:putative transcriptional regulator
METRIAEYRKEKGLTQQELAELVDVSRQTIIALEQGRYNPSLVLACRIAKALGKERVEEVFIVEE